MSFTSRSVTRNRRAICAAVAVIVVLSAGTAAQAAQKPPFAGTVFLDGDIIRASDPTTFIRVTYAGRGQRRMYDRRVDRIVTVKAFVFTGFFRDGPRVELRVNPEFRYRDIATHTAKKYARIMGQLPRVLRNNLDTVSIHGGRADFGGGSRDVVIHTGRGAEYERTGVVEETLAHEAAHTALDGRHARATGWRAAQFLDPTFISTYARSRPVREDIAESFLPYLAVRYRRTRIDPLVARKIVTAIPARMTYFNRQHFDLRPFAP